MASGASLDWTHWGAYADLPIETLIKLSFGIDPDAKGTVTGEGFSKRLSIARNHIANGALETTRIREGRYPGEETVFVDLRHFATWALGIGWLIPEEFPRARGRAHSVVPQKGGHTSVSLPHTTKDLEALFAIIREHWADASKPPKANDVGLAIDKAMGWTSPNGNPSRTAQSLAGMIRPDGHAEADKRSRRRRKP